MAAAGRPTAACNAHHDIGRRLCGWLFADLSVFTTVNKTRGRRGLASQRRSQSFLRFP